MKRLIECREKTVERLSYSKGATVTESTVAAEEDAQYKSWVNRKSVVRPFGESFGTGAGIGYVKLTVT